MVSLFLISHFWGLSKWKLFQNLDNKDANWLGFFFFKTVPFWKMLIWEIQDFYVDLTVLMDLQVENISQIQE